MSQESQTVTLREAISEKDLATARRLFREYAEWLAVDLSFQSFEEELATLPAPYIRPLGFILLAQRQNIVAGCIGLRPIDRDIGEIKRLYVAKAHRGHGIGRCLIETTIAESKKVGYARLRLDTLPAMKTAQRLYEALGFKPIAPYYHNPIEGTKYLELTLD
jgi:GNAT superfamily N-acetyltransferase